MVVNRQPHLRIFAADRQFDRSGRATVLHRIAQQIGEHLTQPGAIPPIAYVSIGRPPIEAES